MNIAYQGSFLKQGLEQAGHTVMPIPAVRQDINTLLKDLPYPADLILLELFGQTVLPLNLHACTHPLAAYCIDSPLNEFWLTEIGRLFDTVFVDQLSSVHRFEQQGIKTVWLPLFVPEQDFRPPTVKRYDITFVGTISPQRVKRSNLLTLLGRHFRLNICQDISTTQMLDMFAASKIVLNENLFNGLTLRVFQGLAAGALVLTEEGCGMTRFFQDGKHLHLYQPHTVVRLIKDVLSRYEDYAVIAHEGQKICKQEHCSFNRVQTLMAAVKRGGNARLSPRRRRFHEAVAGYRLAMRYGGSSRDSAQELNELAQGADQTAAEASLYLGDMAVRRGQPETACRLYARATNLGCSVLAQAKTALLQAQAGQTAQARRHIATLLTMPEISLEVSRELTYRIDTATQTHDIFLLLAELFFLLGKTFELGFQKQFEDICPDTALELAKMAWKYRPEPAGLDLMLKCVQPYGIQGELLPLYVEGIQKGILTDTQLLQTVEIAESYYDIDLATTVIKALRTRQTTMRKIP